jgi:hypothetical protein
LSHLTPRLIWTDDATPALTGRRRPWRAGTAPVRTDAFDELSFNVPLGGRALEDHLAAVASMAAAYAESVKLPPSLVSAVELAGRFHDLGKLDVRFQAWLDPTNAGQPLAKSAYDFALSEQSVPRRTGHGAGVTNC